MGVHGEGFGQATATLTEVEGSTSTGVGIASPFGPWRRPASELATASDPTAVQQRRIGAPRAVAATRATAAAGAGEVAPTAIPRERPRPARRLRSADPPAAEPAPVRPSRVRDPEHHCFSGTVALTVGPFEALDQIANFAEALSSIPGVGSVRVRTFDRTSVVFDVDLAEPIAVIGRLRARSYRPLRLLYANERIIRFKLV